MRAAPRAPAAVGQLAASAARDAIADFRGGCVPASPLSAACRHPFGEPLAQGALAAASLGGLSAPSSRLSAFGAGLLPTRLASPAPGGVRASGAGLALPRAAPTQPTHLPTPKLSLRMRSALPPSPQPWAGAGPQAAGSQAADSSGLFQPAL